MFRCGDYSFPLGKKTYVMGILNYTPDSFSDGGEYYSPEKAAAHALEMQEQGADIIDLGANSTRPGAVILSEEDELAHLKEVIPAVINAVSVPVSVDTFYPACARFALSQGAVIINDVSGRFNPGFALLANKYNAGYIVTHNPQNADTPVDYQGSAVTAVRLFFLDCLEKAGEAGVDFSHICLDPGFGFSKTNEDNFDILNNLSLLKFGGIALLAGVSRKRFIRLNKDVTVSQADAATSVANALAIAGGADIIRVHNVPLAVSAAALADKTVRNENG